VPFRIRLGAKAKLALDKEAKAQGRPSANLAQWIIAEWLRAPRRALPGIEAFGFV
jgi:hypothetical protein